MHEPKRFFSFHTDDGLRRAVAPSFELLEFRAVPVGGRSDRSAESGLHFQAHLLRRSPDGPAGGAGHPGCGRL